MLAREPPVKQSCNDCCCGNQIARLWSLEGYSSSLVHGRGQSLLIANAVLLSCSCTGKARGAVQHTDTVLHCILGLWAGYRAVHAVQKHLCGAVTVCYLWCPLRHSLHAALLPALRLLPEL